MAALAAVLVAAVAASYRYLRRREQHRHETEMLRGRRDAELLTDDRSHVDRELDRERE
jgi:hypothetical protein